MPEQECHPEKWLRGQAPPLTCSCAGRRAEAIRTGFMLSQGGEFAFVLLSLANELKILPTELNRLLIIVVVLSMALTPALAEAGKRYAEASEGDEASGELPAVQAGFDGLQTFQMQQAAQPIFSSYKMIYSIVFKKPGWQMKTISYMYMCVCV